MKYEILEISPVNPTRLFVGYTFLDSNLYSIKDFTNCVDGLFLFFLLILGSNSITNITYSFFRFLNLFFKKIEQ